ncbi:V-type ATP synthase subunit F [Planctomycetota bacterium]
MKYSIIGDEDAVLGFRMVGVTGKVATNSDEAKRAFDAILEDRENCIIIITERVADMIREFSTDRGDSRPKRSEDGQAGHPGNS